MRSVVNNFNDNEKVYKLTKKSIKHLKNMVVAEWKAELSNESLPIL